jgi:hypothetical protein
MTLKKSPLIHTLNKSSNGIWENIQLITELVPNLFQGFLCNQWVQDIKLSWKGEKRTTDVTEPQF